MSRTKAVEPSFMDLIAVKEAQASKLSSGAEGKITYQLALSTDRKQVFIALVDSGSQGYFSREWINLDAILEILESLGQRAEAFPSKVLLPYLSGAPAIMRHSLLPLYWLKSYWEEMESLNPNCA